MLALGRVHGGVGLQHLGDDPDPGGPRMVGRWTGVQNSREISRRGRTQA